MDTSQIVLSKPDGYKNTSTSESKKIEAPKEKTYLSYIIDFLYSFY